MIINYCAGSKRIWIDDPQNMSFASLYTLTKEFFNEFVEGVDFPFEKITSESFNIINGWSFGGDEEIKSITDSGWTDTTNNKKYMGIKTVGEYPDDCQFQYSYDNGENWNDFSKKGQVNEAIEYCEENDPNKFIIRCLAPGYEGHNLSSLKDIGCDRFFTMLHYFPFYMKIKDPRRKSLNDICSTIKESYYAELKINILYDCMTDESKYHIAISQEITTIPGNQ